MPYDIQYCPICSDRLSITRTHYHHVENYEVQYAVNPKYGWTTTIIQLSFTNEGLAYYNDSTGFIRLNGIQPMDKSRADTLFLLRK